MSRYRTKKKSPLKILTAISLILGGLFIISKQIKKPENNQAIQNAQDILVAEFGDEKIYKSDIERKINSTLELNSISSPTITFEELADNSIEPISKEIFIERKILKKAAELGIDRDSNLVDKVNSYKVALTRQTYLDSVINVSNEEALEYFAKKYNNSSIKKEFRISQIVLSKKSEAEKIKKMIKSDNFGKISKKYSIRKFGPQQDGDVGFVKEDDFLPKVKSEVFSMRVGEVSKPIEIDGLWYIVKLTNIIKPKIPSFEEVKTEIISELKNEKIKYFNSELTAQAKYNLIVRPKNDSVGVKPEEENIPSGAIQSDKDGSESEKETINENSSTDKQVEDN